MQQDRLRDLLVEADAAAGPAATSSDLAEQVRGALKRRRTRRLAGGAIATSVVVAVAAVTIPFLCADRPTQRPPGPGAPREIAGSHGQADELRAEIARLDAEADARMEVVTQMLAISEAQQRLAAARKQLARPDPIQRLQRQVDEAAAITLFRAESIHQSSQDESAAIQAYRRVIELSPQSTWADQARRKLAEIQTQKGELL